MNFRFRLHYIYYGQKLREYTRHKKEHVMRPSYSHSVACGQVKPCVPKSRYHRHHYVYKMLKIIIYTFTSPDSSVMETSTSAVGLSIALLFSNREM